MIRVNLVDAGRHVEKRRVLVLPEGQQLVLAGMLLLIVTALIVGWRAWTLAQTEAALDVEIVAAQQQEAQLAEVLRQVQSFEARRLQLQQRVALIDELRRGQAVPVHVIDQVSRALPEGMWLTRLTQSGMEIAIEGDCLSLMALSDFVGNLEGSQYFARPVEIVNSEVVPARDSLPEVIHFSVKGTFQLGTSGSPAAGNRPPATAGQGATGGTGG